MKSVLLLVSILVVGSAGAESPYAGQHHREIKSLSEAEIDGYLAGKGMGLAKAAELNGYPGPRHVLDLADELELTPEQRKQTQVIFERMHAKAVRLGEMIVEHERRLDGMFSSGEVEDVTLQDATRDLGNLMAKLRYTHLTAHLEQAAIMEPGQIAGYRRLRGYGQSDGDEDHRHGASH